MRTAFRVEVEQIKCVIFGLLAIEYAHGRGADLEFQHQDGVLGQQNGIDPSSQTKQRIFEQNTPGAVCGLNTVRNSEICCRHA